MDKNYFIYIYKFPNGKVYIGQTHKGTYRYGNVSQYKNQFVHRALLKYPDYEKQILCYCAENEVDDLEIYFIKKYNSTDRRYGYNRESGGNKNKVVSEETKQKLREKNLGKKLSEETKNKIRGKTKGVLSPVHKSVIQYDLDGNFIKEWGCIADASRELKIVDSHISYVCKNKRNQAGNFKWKYKGDTEHVQ